jgi:hypothetical protein
MKDEITNLQQVKTGLSKYTNQQSTREYQKRNVLGAIFD